MSSSRRELRERMERAGHRPPTPKQLRRPRPNKEQSTVHSTSHRADSRPARQVTSQSSQLSRAGTFGSTGFNVSAGYAQPRSPASPEDRYFTVSIPVAPGDTDDGESCSESCSEASSYGGIEARTQTVFSHPDRTAEINRWVRDCDDGRQTAGSGTSRSSASTRAGGDQASASCGSRSSMRGATPSLSGSSSGQRTRNRTEERQAALKHKFGDGSGSRRKKSHYGGPDADPDVTDFEE
nr:uncharacterized protein CI109_005347 [Kwoniella shandongensis]KAA5526390.1 hypothetical protein CI109_005347 [Kwoniella shandongensis]